MTSYRLTLRLPDGRRYRTAKTRREARARLRQAQAEAARGTLAANRPPTFSEYPAEWLEGTRDKAKSRTFATYRLDVQRVPPWLGALRLDELRPRHFHKFYDELTAQNKAPRTVRQVHMMPHKALADALRLDAVTRNPTDATRLPRIPNTETSWYTPDELGHVLQRVRSLAHDSREGDRLAYGVSANCMIDVRAEVSR